MSDARLAIDSPAAQSHLSMVQGVISRLASNSSACKAWAIGLVSAIVLVVADRGHPDLLIVAGIPVLLFLVLDAYYLGLERRCRSSYETFVRRLHAGEATVDDAFVLAPRPRGLDAIKEAYSAISSFSVYPFYVTLAFMVYLVSRILQ